MKKKKLVKPRILIIHKGGQIKLMTYNANKVQVKDPMN